MANPILKKLSKPGISNSEIAKLLQKHIGTGLNEAHCKDAFEALNRIKLKPVANIARVVGMLAGNGSNYCEMVRQAVEQIQGTSVKPNKIKCRRSQRPNPSFKRTGLRLAT